MSRKGNGEGRREVGGTKNPDGGQAETMQESIRRLRAAGAEGEIAVWGRPGGTRLAALTGGLPPGLHALMLSCRPACAASPSAPRSTAPPCRCCAS